MWQQQQQPTTTRRLRPAVQWHPASDRYFVSVADQIRFCRIDIPSNNYALKPEIKIEQTIPISGVKCVDWYPSKDDSTLYLATGHGQKGTIQFFDFNMDMTSQPFAEITPNAMRTCNSVAWDPYSPSRIAAGFELIRNDSSIHIWDVVTMSDSLMTNNNNSGNSNVGNSGSNHSKSSASVGIFGNSEGAAVLSWIPQRESCIAVGTSFKWLRIYDIRSSASVQQVTAHVKEVNGVVFDPSAPNIFATHADTSSKENIKIWDIRKLTENGEIATIPTLSRPVLQVVWSPISHPGVLCVAHADDKSIYFWDVKRGLLDNAPSSLLNDPPLLSTASTPLNVILSPIAQFPASALMSPVNQFSNGDNTLTKQASNTSTIQSQQSNSSTNTSVGASTGKTQQYPKQKKLTTKHIACISWKDSTGKGKSSGNNQDDDYLGRWLLTVSWSGSLQLIAISSFLPLSLGPNNELLYARGRKLFSSLTTQKKIKGKFDELTNDISTKMFNRADAGYALDPFMNISILRNEVAKNGADELTQEIIRIWEWVSYSSNLSISLEEAGLLNLLFDQAAIAGLLPDSLPQSSNEQQSKREPSKSTQVENLTPRHVDQHHLRQQPLSQNVIKDPSEPQIVYGFYVFRSDARKLALHMCGWCDESTSVEFLRQVEISKSRSEWSRAVALCIFHCDLGQAVSIIRDIPKPSEILQHVEYTLSGYPGWGSVNVAPSSLASYSSASLPSITPFIQGRQSHGSDPLASSSHVNLWRNSCEKLQSRLEEYGEIFLSAALTFLFQSCATPLNTPIRQFQFSERQMKNMSLSDLSGFACKFFPDDTLNQFIRERMQALSDHKSSFVDAILFLGLGKNGIRILDNYLDATGDIQTTALLLSLLNDSGKPSSNIKSNEHSLRQKEIQNKKRDLLDSYRDLLNRWCLWEHRAELDVLLSSHRQRQLNLSASSNDGSMIESQGGFYSLDPSLPPQIQIQCGTCGLPLDYFSILQKCQGNAGWLSKLGATITICPNCNNSLPICSICLMPMQSINPFSTASSSVSSLPPGVMGSRFMDMASRGMNSGDPRSRVMSSAGMMMPPSAVTSQRKTSQSISMQKHSKATMVSPFSDWFSFCLNCRHSGHASCFMEWFKNHEMCPASNCSCQCSSIDSYSRR